MYLVHFHIRSPYPLDVQYGEEHMTLISPGLNPPGYMGKPTSQYERPCWPGCQWIPVRKVYIGTYLHASRFPGDLQGDERSGPIWVPGSSAKLYVRTRLYTCTCRGIGAIPQNGTGDARLAA